MARAYAALLVFFPRRFREEFGYEMMCDFVDATRRARQGGRLGLVSLWASCTADIALNLITHWVRTGVPTLIAISASWSILLFSLLLLQTVPQTNALFTPLHVVWLVIVCAMTLLCVAVGHYHARHS